MTRIHSFRRFGLLCYLLLALTCSSPSGQTSTTQVKFSAKQHPDFGAYWYAGQAEMSRYQLEQAHYGALYSGEARVEKPISTQ